MALSDLVQGCSNKFDTVMIEQECYKVDNTRVYNILFLYQDSIWLPVLEQPCKKSA
jgi:hypothetical protein